MRTHAVAVLLLATAALAQGLDGADRIHPYLSEQLRHTAANDKIPVYFVMRDQLVYDDWFPRLRLASVMRRRATVVSELRAHAARTQDEVLRQLRREQVAGRAASIRSNWLGNFVAVLACPAAVRRAAALPSVAQVWADATWPMQQVVDGETSLPTAPVSAAPATCAVAGVGPVETGAALVWALGVRGQGVTICNADCGINLQHQDLRNRLWSNPGEIPANGIDDDGNGFVDDVHGWMFNPWGGDPDLEDHGGHGTNTAGCLVADGTCTGVVNGQAPAAQVMTCRLGWGETAQWDALQYAIFMGAELQTSSHSYKVYFVPPPNYRMHRIVGDNTLAAGLIRTNSTSNDGAACAGAPPQRAPFNVSAPGNLPPPYLDPSQQLRGARGGVLGVGAYDVRSGALETYSPCGPVAWNLADLMLALPGAYPADDWDPRHNDYPFERGHQQGLLKPDLIAPDGLDTATSGVCGQTPFYGTSAATPAACGVFALWKSANRSLKPEDVAMIVHQTARRAGDEPNKRNTWGAGKVDALAGLELALCVHRVQGEPSWSVATKAGSDLVLEIDASPSVPAALLLGLSRLPAHRGSPVIGVGPPVFLLWSGMTDTNGDVVLALQLPAGIAGLVHTQAFVDDRAGPIGKLLASNVIGIEIVP